MLHCVKTMKTDYRVLIVGAGFGGMRLAERLKGTGVDVTIVDRHNHHTFQPLLYQVATAGLEAEQIARSIRDHFQGVSNVSFQMGTMVDLQPDEQTIQLDDNRRLYYDDLVIGAGATTAYFDIPGAREHSHTLKTIDDALRIRSHILNQFERADQTNGQDVNLRTVIVGGGPTGVELSGALIELYDEVLKADYPDLSFNGDVTLVEQRPNLLHRYPDHLRQYAQDKLREHGVDLRLNHEVSDVESDHLHFVDSSSLSFGTLIWSAGIRAATVADTIAERLDAEQTTDGRLRTDSRLCIDGQADCFAIGDIAAVEQDSGLLPQRAPVAQQAGDYMADQILHRSRRDSTFTRPFTYRPKGQTAVVGRGQAIAQIARPSMDLKGLPAWLLWAGVHLSELTGCRNRFMVLLEWLNNYATHDRNARIILPSNIREVGVEQHE